MNTVFVGGSRHVSRLPALAKKRLDNVISSGHRIVVGDAAGADKAVQKYLFENSYKNITVYCSGERPRNNVGDWKICKVHTDKHLKGFHFFAAKDREMAKEADFGLMIWDGKSAGTALNVLRLLRAGKKAVLISTPEKHTYTFKAFHDWTEFLAHCDRKLVEDLRARATPEEWMPLEEPSSDSVGLSLEAIANPSLAPAAKDPDLTLEINAALASGDLATVFEALGSIAKAHGMSHVAKEAGLARESLYRSLKSGGNPEFSTVMKVMSSLGLQLSVKKNTAP